jgi:hypothetical protein
MQVEINPHNTWRPLEILMKAETLTTRFSIFVTQLLDVLAPDEKPAPKIHSRKELPRGRSDRAQRKEFYYHLRVIDDETKEVVGHLEDISTGGFRLNTQKPVPINQDFRLCMQLPKEVSDIPFMVFEARSRWCSVNPIDSDTYNVGYQLIQFAPKDLEVFIRMMEKYGRESDKRTIDLRRSNKW